jgi:hypothetical protein
MITGEDEGAGNHSRAWRAYWLPCIGPPLNLKVLFPKFDFDWEAYDWQTF